MTFDDYIYLMKQNVVLKSDGAEDIIRSRFKSYSKIRFVQNSVDENVVRNWIFSGFINPILYYNTIL